MCWKSSTCVVVWQACASGAGAAWRCRAPTDNRQLTTDNPRYTIRAAMSGPITNFIDHHYRHFNAAALKAAAQDYNKHLEKGGQMLVTLAGAMSTAELGLSLAEMIRQDKVSA